MCYSMMNQYIIEPEGNAPMNRYAHPTATIPLALLLLATTALPPAAAQAPSAADDFVPVTDAMLRDRAPGDWLTWRRTLDGWGYSLLDKIRIFRTWHPSIR